MKTDLIGENLPRIDGVAKVTGLAKYPGDINLPNQAYMQVVFSIKPHAVIKKLDISKAENIPGVIMILTARDVPCNEYGLIMPDQPVLCGPGSEKKYAERVRFIGDQIALVIAENEDIAKKAASLISVDYEELPIITNALDAFYSNDILVHPDRETNIICHYKIRQGDVDNAFRDADIIIESDYHTPPQEHVFLQPEAGLGYVDEEGRITVIVAGQWAHEDQEQIAHALQMPIDKIRVTYPAIGGAFGGREDMSIQIVLGLATKALNERGIHRPVKTVWSREESFFGHHKRHPYHIHAKWAASKDGKLTASEMRIISDGGAYAYTSTKVLGNTIILANGPYFIQNSKIDAYSVYTNNIPSGAFRGFGGPQGCFAAEMQMNKIADALSIDPVELRMRNLIDENLPTLVGTPLPKGISINKVIESCAQAAGWEQTNKGWQLNKKWVSETNENQKRFSKGIGFAAGYKNAGFSFGAPEECWATIELHGEKEIEKVILRHAGADVGQGAHTIFVQVAATHLQVPVEKIQLIASDTAFTKNSGSASASRMTFMASNAIIGAVQSAMQKWKNEDRPAISTYRYKPPETTPLDPETGYCMPNFSYGYVAEAVELIVDKDTGEISIINVVCADDVGRAMNPLSVRGQIEGAIVQAQGYTILENLVYKNGNLLTKGLSTYLIPTIMDIPENINSIIIEEPDPIGPDGARGMGEMPFLPFAPAVSAAVHMATNKWLNSFPLTQEKIVEGLGETDR